MGVSSNLKKRIWQHKYAKIEGFSKKYKLNKIVYFEEHNDAIKAIEREKNIKKWKRDWKIKLIEKKNPYWKDLYQTL